MKLRDLSVGKRLGVGFAFQMLFVLFLVAASMVQSARYRGELYTAMGGLNQRVKISVELRHDALQLYRALTHAAQDGSGQIELAEVARQNSALRAEQEIIARLPESDRNSFGVVADPIAELSGLAGDLTGGAMQDSDRQRLHRLQEQLPLFDTCLDAQLKAQAGLPEQSEKSYRAKAVSTVGFVILLMISFGAAIAWALTRSVVAPLKHAVAVAAEIAGGNLDLHIEVRGRDELGQLQAALKEMHQAISGVIGRVRSASDSISGVSQDIAQGSTALGARTEAQAASLEETAASMEQLSSTVANNAEHVQQADRMAAAASRVATESGGIVAQVVSTMEEIRQASDRIRNIVGVIDGIAFQTNILALNASVEAARVGEQGQGFAVVASEVRNLAHRAAAAAKDIRKLIDDSMSRVETGCQYAGQAGATMQQVVTSIANVNRVVTEISGANREQSAGLEQINQAVVELDEVAQRNAEQVHQATANAELLMQQVAELSQAANAFRLGESRRQRNIPAAGHVPMLLAHA